MTQSYPDKATLSFLFFNVCSVIKPLALSFVISSIWKEIKEKNLERTVIPGSEASNEQFSVFEEIKHRQTKLSIYAHMKRHSTRKFRHDTKRTIINVTWVCRGSSKLYNDPLYNHNKNRRQVSFTT